MWDCCGCSLNLRSQEYVGVGVRLGVFAYYFHFVVDTVSLMEKVISDVFSGCFSIDLLDVACVCVYVLSRVTDNIC